MSLPDPTVLAWTFLTRHGELHLSALTPEQASDVAQIVGYGLNVFTGCLALIVLFFCLVRAVWRWFDDRLEDRRAARLD